jgi:hypothetical protein
VREGDRVQGLVVQTKGGRSVLLCKAVVDASGDADVAAFCGAPFEMADVGDLQQVSCDYVGCGVDAARVIEWARENQNRLEDVRGLEFVHEGAGVEPMFTIIVPGDQTQREGGSFQHVGVVPTVKLCVYRQAVRLQGNVEIDPLDPKALTQAEVKGLQGALEHLKYLQSIIPGFENTFIVAQSHLGVRETRRIIGDHVLTIDEITSQVRFDDVVALNCRGLDYHLAGTVFEFTPVEGHHDVPLGALLPQGVENVVVCGRSVSCDHLSQASLRGAATCMATGHAAGTTAALAAMHDTTAREMDIRLVQRTLVDQDAILGTGERKERFAR